MIGFSLVFDIILLLALFTGAHGVACEKNWFGTNCSFQCHCEARPCLSNGQCDLRDSCTRGWFHDSCQYSDLLYFYNDRSTDFRLSDFNDYTCITENKSVLETRVGFITPFHVYWVRLVLSNRAGGKMSSLDLAFNDIRLPCRNGRRFVVNHRVIDFECNVMELVQSIVIKGPGASFLCSVYVSGGQNMALKQLTAMSSVDVDAVSGQLRPDLAVDGIQYAQGRCARTNGKEKNVQTFQLTFRVPVFLSYVVLYGGSRLREAMYKFLLLTLDKNQTVVESHYYIYSGEEGYTSRHMITLNETSKVVNSLSITTNVSRGVMEICEVEAYGIPVCEADRVGFACSSTCTCHSKVCAAHNSSCTVSCVLGHFGPLCEPCPETCYPPTSCDTTTGSCYNCTAGYTGSKCEHACPSGTYGPGCFSNCSIVCKDKVCDPITGDCLSCKGGFYGKACENDCPENCLDSVCDHNGGCFQCKLGFYGEDCLDTCSPECHGNICNITDGHCLSCKDGYHGMQCSFMCPAHCTDRICDSDTGDCIECDPGYYGTNCSLPCPGKCIDDICDIVNGCCSGECVDGYFGSACLNSCAILCKDKICDKFTGLCIACDNTYGTHCSVECPHVCANRTCGRYSGNCIVCEMGFYGNHCDKRCPTNCANKECHINTGSCSSCISGYHGKSCTKPCPKDCVQSACDMKTAACVKAIERESNTYVYVIIATLASVSVVALLLLYKKRHPVQFNDEEDEEDEDDEETSGDSEEDNTMG